MRAPFSMIGNLLRQPATRYLSLAVALGYTLLYSWMSGDIATGGSNGIGADFPAWHRLFEMRAPFQFEPVGLITLGPITWTFSPLNSGLALGLGGLIGLNAAAAWLAWRTPHQCRTRGAGTGLLAALPALLAGGACCGPLLLIWLGLPLAGILANVAPWLIPLSVLLLSIGLWRLTRLKTDESPRPPPRPPRQ